MEKADVQLDKGASKKQRSIKHKSIRSLWVLPPPISASSPLLGAGFCVEGDAREARGSYKVLGMVWEFKDGA